MNIRKYVYGLLAALVCGSALANTCPILPAGSTSQSVNVTFIDDTTGLPTAGLAYNSGGIDINYTRMGAAQTAVTEVTQTAAGAYSSGGFVSVGQGSYRFDIPDAALSAGVPYVVVTGVITGYTMLPCTILLTPSVNAAALGGTAQTGRDVGASVLLSSGTGPGQISLSSGAVLLQATQSGVTIPTVTTLTNAPSDSSGVTTLLSRLSATRAGYLDNLSAGAVATAAGLDAACPKDVVCTTVATAPTTTTVTLSAAPNTDTQLDGWAILFTNNGDGDDYCLRSISSVSTGTITYDSACPFTVGAGDAVALLPAFLASPVSVLPASVRDIVIEDQDGGISLGCALAVVMAYAAGDLATSGSNSTYDDPSGTETRITGTVSSPGNRAATVTCPSY